MTRDPDPQIALRQRARDALREAGVRVTPQRLEILVFVAGSPDHPDAEAVLDAVRERLPRVSPDTVYRTLWTLSGLGLITTLGHPQERFRFDGNLRRHHHFICTRCGLARDFYSEALDQVQPPETVGEFGLAKETQVEVRGICHACASEADQPSPPPRKRDGP